MQNNIQISSQLRKNLAKEIVISLKKVVGESAVSLHEPIFKGNELRYIQDCIDSTFVSSVGRFVDRFEDELTKFTGAKYAVAVVNGTAALHIALKISGVKCGDEVLVPALTFVATANAVAYCNATPHFVDSETHTFGVDFLKLREYLSKHTEQRDKQCVNKLTGKVIRAFVPMHVFGHPANIDELLSIAKDFNILLIEDAAESLGSYYQGQHTGTFGLMGILSFNGNKIITTGGGGAILTNNEHLAKYAKHLTTTAKLTHDWEFRHDEIGYNYRMPNLNAALGCAQIEQIQAKIQSKRKLYTLYSEEFRKIEGVTLIKEPKNCKSNYWFQTLMLSQKYSDQLLQILELTNNSGLMTRPVWTLMHELEPFKECPRMDLSTAESLSKRLINIPSNLNL